MPGNKNSGRKKTTPIAVKKARGTYRKDRDGKKEEVENFISDSLIKSETEIIPPKTITDKYVIEAYKMHTNWLIQYNQLCNIDIAELDQLFITLQQLRAVTKQRMALEEKGVIENLEEYSRLSSIELKLRKLFVEMGKDFLMSPVVRSKLTIEQLQADKMVAEKKERESSMMEDLFAEEKK